MDMYRIIILFLILKGVFMTSSANASTYFGIDIDLHNVAVDVRVNDIPTYFDEEKGQLTIEKPVPGYIIDGSNSLSLKVFLPYDGDDRMNEFLEGAYAQITLFQQDLNNPSNKKELLLSSTIKINGNQVIAKIEDHRSNEKFNPDISLSRNNEAYVEVSTLISSPFPRWVWQDGQIIQNTKENYDSLLAVYKDVHTAMKTKDLKKLKHLYSARAEETAIAFGLADEDSGQMKLSTGEDMNDPNLVLYDFHTDDVELEVVGNGKLARIRDYDDTQPIFYYQTNADLLHFHKFMFYLNNDNQWIMIR